MMKIVPLMFLLVTATSAFAQRYKVVKSDVSFYSEAPLENIEAHNTSAAGLFDEATGGLAFSIPINKFKFKKALMQEHFNEKYMESDKFPNATFKGKLAGFDKSKATQKVKASGLLNIHGVEKKVTIDGTITRKGNKYIMDAKFPAALADYKIERPKLLWENIAEVVDVTIHFELEQQ